MNFDRPIIILAAPRSGSTLLFETLMATKNLYSIGGESHAVIEHIPELSTVANGYISNTLTKNHATSDVTSLLKQRFSMGLRDREGRPPNKHQAVRFLEKTPKNALRVEFLNHVFPDALFIHLVRDPLPNISSIIEAWQSGRFRTYPQLLKGLMANGRYYCQTIGRPWSVLRWKKLRASNGTPVIIQLQKV
ncbi:sulfotransferase family protein [Psychrosphaera algicola]|uniref:Sulfotransferase n=1 Tax=Psychrosphaera algicola TaxID=3023714 RepID=A0ABT5FD62_9GAMM|nr:sulfotransferase [Psychrosphaera sp. G1-22]MDC2888872.1 sulfotransferase [Psychrosphaera sp. G1-22]